MSVHQLSLYTLGSDDQELYATGVGLEAFSAERYSLLKYGSALAAEQWGEALAARLVQTLGDELLSTAGPIITASAFHQVPTAAFAVSLTTRTVIDRLRSMQHLNEMECARIVRDRVFEGEYETLSAAARRQVIQRMGLSYDGPKLAGRHLIVIDDIRVSGTHEEVLLELLRRERPAKLTFAYLVQAEAELGQRQPDIEQRLNNAAIGSLDALRELLRSEPTLLNARVVKRILLWPRSHDELDTLLSELPDTILTRLYKAALADGYHHMPTFQAAFLRLEALMQQRLREDFTAGHAPVLTHGQLVPKP